MAETEDKSIRDQLIEAGMDPKKDFSAHESDLYVRRTPVSEAVIKNYEFRRIVRTFRARDDRGWWYDIPFANDAWWEGRLNI